MSLSTTQYGYIVDPMVPFTDDKGKTIKNGFIRVFMAGTSTPVITYRNYDGATNQEKIELDNSGRVKHNVIGSKGSLYKVVVYNILHSQENPLLTVDKIAVLGASINASGATIVTGLDSVTVQEENFLKATVEGTGVELALDPTEVTSDVNTISAAETAAPDYVLPLLDKTGTGDGKKISLANLFKFALDWISRLATTVTSFASGDFIAVSNTTNGARKMSKDTLLELTAQNALAGNVATEFVPNSTTTVAGNAYVYNGSLYVAKVDGYQGPWDASKFDKKSVDNFLSVVKCSVEANTNRISGENLSISTSTGVYRQGSIGSNGTWFYNPTHNPSHVAYKVLKGSVVTLENTGINPNGSWFALVTDFADEDKANGDAISFSAQVNERKNLAIGDSVKIYIDSDLWLVCNVIDGAGVADQFNVSIVLPKASASERNSISGNSVTYNLSDFISYAGIVGDPKWYVSGSAANTAFPIKKGQLVTIENNGAKIIYCGLLTSSFVLKNQISGAPIPFASQMPRRFSVAVGETKTLEVADDSAWLVFNVVDGAGDVCTAEVTISEKGVTENIDDFKYGKTETIDTDERLAYKAIVGDSTWYLPDSPTPYHVPIKVFAGQSVTVDNTGNKTIYCGLLTSSYVLGDQTRYAPIAFSSQMPGRFSVGVGESKTFVVKDDSEWLVLNVIDGAGDACSADVTLVTTTKTLSTDFFALYSRVRPNINTADGTLEIDRFTIIFYGDDVYNYYTAVNPQSSVPLKNGTSSAQKLVYNKKTHLFRTCDFGDDVNILDDVVVGAFYVNSGESYSAFNSASLAFEYTIDGMPIYSKDDTSTYELDYEGEPVKIVANKYKRVLYKTLTDLTFHQSMAIYGDYALFAIYDKNTSGTTEPGKLSFYLYNIKTGQRLAGIDVPYTGWTIPHCNTAMFGKEYGSENSVVPLLYLSQWNGERACLVYDITLTGSTYSAELVQTISTSGISSDVEGSGMRDWVVDVDDNSIYSFGYLLNSDSVAEGNKIMLMKFDLPELSEGDKLFGTEDVKDSYNVPFIKYYQDKTINFGKMIIAAGIGAADDTKVSVLDLSKKTIVTEIPIGKTYQVEPEGLDVYRDKLLIDTGRADVYEIKTC